MADLRAGVIGLGVMGRHHARVLSTLSGVSLVGIVEPTGVAPDFSNYLVHSVDELLNRGVDYCFVAVPTALHEEVGLTLASAGIHALVEKPLAADVESATRLANAFESRGLIAAVGHIERYNPALSSARDRIHNGDLGQLHQVTTRRQGPFPTRIADVGVVKDLASHDIDLTAWITSQPFVSVAARTAHRTGRQHEDLVVVTGQLSGGVVTSHVVNWLSPFKERQVVISGERGAFVVDTLSADLTFHANGSVESQWPDIATFRGVVEGDVVRFAIPKPEPLRTEHEAFRDAVLGKTPPLVSMREGVEAVRVADAILESAATGRFVSLVGD